MKSNLTWLCLAMFLVIALDFGFGIAGGTSAFMAGWNSVDDEKAGEIDEDYTFLTYHAATSHMSDKTSITLINEKTGKPEQVWINAVQMQIDQGPFYSILFSIMAVIILVCYAFALVMFLQFIRNVYRNEVFTSNNCMKLRLFGWSFFLANLLEFVISLIYMFKANEAFALKGHTIAFDEYFDLLHMILAIFALIMAEAFAIGMRQKEELDLTV